MQRWKNLEGTSLPKTGEGVVAACCRQRSSLCGWTIAGLQLLGEQEAAFWVACEPQLRTDTRHAGEVGMLPWVRGLAGLVSTLGKDRWAERVGEPVWTGGLECDVSISRAVRQWSPGQAGAVSLPRDLYLI